MRAAIVEKIPFFALSIASSIITIMAQQTAMVAEPLPTRLLVAVKSLTVYLLKMLFPLNLIPFYPYPNTLEVSLINVEYLLAAVSLTGITIACAVTVKKQKLWLSAWLYYIITLIPVLGIIQVGIQAMADRYTYLPSLGPFLIIGLSVAWGSAQLNRTERKSVKMFSAAAAIIVLLSLLYLDVKQTGIWGNSISLWSYVIEKEPERIPLAYYNRGLTLQKLGRFDEAIEDFEKTIALDPSEDKAYNELGEIYLNAGLFEKSIGYFNKALAIDPTYVESYNNRGAYFASTGQYEKALEDFNKAIQLKKDDAAAHYNRGNLYRRAGNKELAISDFQKACDLGIGKACDALLP